MLPSPMPLGFCPGVVWNFDRTWAICTSGSTSSNTSLILFLLVSCAYLRSDRRAEPPPCHLEIVSAGSRVKEQVRKRGVHNHGCLLPLHGVRQTMVRSEAFRLLPISCSSFLLPIAPSRLAGAICRSLDHNDLRLGALLSFLILSSRSGISYTSRDQT